VLGHGAGIQDPPQTTPYGDLFLAQPIFTMMMPDIGSDGLSLFTAAVPGAWIHDEQHPLQALAGNELTNLLVLTVE